MIFPEELIAQDPLLQRDSSRLLVLDKKTGEYQHKIFHDLPQFLKKGDCLVLNNTKVIPARLLGSREGKEDNIGKLFCLREERAMYGRLL